MNAYQKQTPYGLWPSLSHPAHERGIPFLTAMVQEVVSAWCGANPMAAIYLDDRERHGACEAFTATSTLLAGGLRRRLVLRGQQGAVFSDRDWRLYFAPHYANPPSHTWLWQLRQPST